MTLESIAGAAGAWLWDRYGHQLQLAYVSNRAGIENSLWLPPGENRKREA